jgi:hypothetical protein
MLRTLFVLLFIMLAAIRNTNGQVSSDTANHTGVLSLRIKSISFVKDNEYSGPVIEGYTLVGFFLHPELVYSPSPKVMLRGGTHLLKYSGTGKFSEIRPVFSASLKLSDQTWLTIGTLSGSYKHKLFDPHFNSERLYNAYAEDGLQITTSNVHIFNDTWINWENFIFKGDSTREIFTFGESFKYTTSVISDFLQLELPVQLQLKHFGGQISNYPQPVETCLNFATGLRINFDLAQKKYGQAGVEYLLFLNNQLNGESLSGIKSGSANWIKAHYTYKALYFGAAYWTAHNYFAPNGNPIYGSVPDFQPGFVVPDRRLINNCLYLNLSPETYFKLFFGIDTYYDLDIKRLDYSFALHLNFDKLFRLAKLM